MARVPRELHAGGWYHVYNRGLSNRAIFECRFDRRFFLSLLAKQVRDRRLVVHAYCLMTNHFHLLVELPGVDLPIAMREIARHYTRRFNARRERDGPLFRARYASRYLEDEAYRETVLWYVDQNPVKAKLVTNAVDHPWSSAHDFDRGKPRPWLKARWVADVVRRSIGVARLRPGSYRVMRDANRAWDAHAQEFVSARLASPVAADEEWSDGHLAEWLRRRADLAEGRGSLVPVASSGAFIELVKAQRRMLGSWELRRGSSLIDLHEVMLLAGLRSLAGLPNRELRARSGLSVSQIARRCSLHRELLDGDPRYCDQFETLARQSRQRSLRCHPASEPE